jgi:hypothetical protein
VFLNEVNSILSEETNFSLTAALHVEEIAPSLYTSKQNLELQHLKDLRERLLHVKSKVSAGKWMLSAMQDDAFWKNIESPKRRLS